MKTINPGQLGEEQLKTLDAKLKHIPHLPADPFEPGTALAELQSMAYSFEQKAWGRRCLHGSKDSLAAVWEDAALVVRTRIARLLASSPITGASELNEPVNPVAAKPSDEADPEKLSKDEHEFYAKEKTELNGEQDRIIHKTGGW